MEKAIIKVYVSWEQNTGVRKQCKKVLNTQVRSQTHHCAKQMRQATFVHISQVVSYILPHILILQMSLYSCQCAYVFSYHHSNSLKVCGEKFALTLYYHSGDPLT